MKRYGVLSLVVVIALLLLTGCGGAHHTSAPTAVTSTATVGPTSSPLCTPAETTMNCVLSTLPPPKSTLRSIPGQQYGLDFGWSAVSAAQAKAAGAKFGVSYFSDDPTKNWTLSLVNSYHALGIKTVAVWESSADRTSTEGGGDDGTFAAGVQDATEARAQATAVGEPSDGVIEFGTDCDCSPSSLNGFFEGADSVLGVADVGDYGGYNQVLWLYQHHLVGSVNWQTYAWSNGLWLPATIAPLEQYLNGNTFDNDRAIAPYYGQWPASPPVNPHHYKWAPNTRHTFRVRAGSTSKCVFSIEDSDCIVVHARERSALIGWDKNGCKSTALGNGVSAHSARCREIFLHMQLLDGRVVYIAHRTRDLKHPVKKPRWGALHYKAEDGHVTTLGGINQQLARRLSHKNNGTVSAW